MLMNISVCVDPTMININPNTLVISIGDCGNPQLMERLNAIPASLYNPPFEAITANIDGDYNTFQQLYFQYLVTNSDVSEFTIAMIRSLIMGKEIVLYLDRNEYDLYFNVLSNYFISSYSLVIGNPYTGILQGGINDNMLQDIVSYLYLTNEMPVDIFIRLYNKPFNQDVVNKLLVDFNMTNKLEQLNCNLEQYNRIFNDIKYDIVSNRTSRRPKIYRNY